MTIPMVSDADAISLVIPAPYRKEDMPGPPDSRISIHEIPTRKMAVSRFRERTLDRDLTKIYGNLLRIARNERFHCGNSVHTAA